MHTTKFETFFSSNFKKIGRVLIHQSSLMENIQSKFLKLVKTNKLMDMKCFVSKL